jgi:hypothetical protein
MTLPWEINEQEYDDLAFADNHLTIVVRSG